MKLTIKQLRKMISEAIEVKQATKEKREPRFVTKDDFCGANMSFRDAIGFPKLDPAAAKETNTRTNQRREFVKNLERAGYTSKEIEKAWLDAADTRDYQGLSKEPPSRNNPWD